MTCIDFVMQFIPENCSTGKGLALATGTSKHEITKVLNGDILDASYMPNDHFQLFDNQYELFHARATKGTNKTLHLTLSPTALGPIGPRVFKGIQLKA